MGRHRRFSRRTLLAAGALLATGCHSHSTSPSPDEPAPDPDAGAVASAQAAEAALIASYDTAIAAARGQRRAHLEVGRAAHTVHRRTLAKLASSASTSGAGPASASGPLHALLASSARRLEHAARRAHSGDVAAVFASIAGSHRALVDE